MPLDTSKHQSDRRRLNRDPMAAIRQDGMYSREIELKRNRGEISCAECRRLKIKCDKQIPCQSCQRRGCASLCPNGSLATGQGTRFVIAATEHLHRRISRMSDRIRQLEDALASLQANVSKDTHPLLSENAIFVDIEETSDKPHESEGEGTGEISTVLGTLSVSDQGTSRFFGSTGGSDLLLIDTDDSAGSPSQHTETSDSSRGSGLPPELQRFSHSFPFTPMGPIKDTIELIRGYLPPWEQASAMAESYLESATWIFRSVTRHQLVNEMLPSIYRKLPPSSEEYNGPHDLALLFSIFALGSALDVNLTTRAAETGGEHFNQLALTALCLQPVLEKPSLVTIQTLHIVSIYHAMLGNDVSGGESSMEFTWSLVNLAGHLAQTIGLHRDPAQWSTDPKIVQRRRMVFWDLFIADQWHALSTGRPPTFNRDFIDCHYPQADDLPATLDPGDNSSLSVWGFRFSCECMAEVVARTLSATSPRYSAIKELDRKIREFALSPEALDAMRGGPGIDLLSVPLSNSMMAFLLGTIHDILSLFLHRNFFVQALVENPVDPIRSQYAPSFMETIRAAKTIIQSVKEQLSIQRVIVCRFWIIWTYTFSASVVFAFIATRGPHSPFANDAMTELDKGCSLIGEAAKDNRRAAKAFHILKRMREKAHRALEAARNVHPMDLPRVPGGVALGMGVIKQEEIDDELAVFAGRSKVFRPSSTSSPDARLAPSMTMTKSNSSGSGLSPDGTPYVQVGEWIARQEPYLGYDPHYVSSIEPPPHPPPHQQHQQHPHQHQYQQQQYNTYAPEQPQYNLEAVHSIPQYTPYSYSQPPLTQPPVHSSLSSSSTTMTPALTLHGSHVPPPHHQQQQDLAEYRSYAAAALAPQTELSELGLAANGSRVSEAWMSFMHQYSRLDGPSVER